MTTRERARAVAIALSELPGWSGTTSDEILERVTAELGDASTLDRFQPLGTTRSHAIPLAPLLHILSGEAPAAGVLSVARGVVLGTQNLVSSPPFPLLEKFLGALPQELRSSIDHRTTLPQNWLTSAAGIIAFCPDTALPHIRKSLRPDQAFEPHPQTVGFAIVFEDSAHASPSLAANDISTSTARGEIGFHDIFLAPSAGTPSAYAEELALALDRIPTPSPPPPVPAISNLRSGYVFRAATDPTVSVHGRESPAGHTIIAEADPLFATVPSPGAVFVKPLPAPLAPSLRFIQANIDTIAVHPFDDTTIAAALSAGAARVCPLGATTQLQPRSHPHGLPTYSPWVRWIDLG